MILTIDAGNTNTVFGAFDDNDKQIFTSRVSTDNFRMEDQYAILISDILRLYSVETSAVKGVIISSVVPPVTIQLKAAIEKICGCKALTVNPGIKTGLNIKIDDPSSLGADMVSVAVGVKARYPLPAVVIDLGTATKIFAIDKTGAFVGGIIAPGVKISAEALAAKTAALPLIGITGEPIRKVIGTDTIGSMRSGLLNGAAYMIDGFAQNFEREIGEKCTFIATGGFSEVVRPLCKTEMILDDDLILTGLLEIYKKNA